MTLPNSLSSVSDVLALANDLKIYLNAAQLLRKETRYQLDGGTSKRQRQRVDLDNLIKWQDDEQEEGQHLTLYQAVTVATEVLRHYAIYQRLSSVEECVFVPLLMTNFTAENIYKWRDALAKSLLPMPADTYLQSLSASTPSNPQQHPLVRAFDANERILTSYANVDYPVGSYDEEAIQFIRGNIRIRVKLPDRGRDLTESCHSLSQSKLTNRRFTTPLRSLRKIRSAMGPKLPLL